MSSRVFKVKEATHSHGDEHISASGRHEKAPKEGWEMGRKKRTMTRETTVLIDRSGSGSGNDCLDRCFNLTAYYRVLKFSDLNFLGHFTRKRGGG